MIVQMFFFFLIPFIQGNQVWKEHVHDLMASTTTILHAAMVDRLSGEIWAADDNFKPTEGELQELISFFDPKNPTDSDSCYMLGQDFEVVSQGIGTLLGRNGDKGFFAVSARDVIVFVVYQRAGEKNVEVRRAVFRTAQFLKILGY